MKTNLDTMRKLYQSKIVESAQMDRKNCPSPKIIAECLQGQSSKRIKKNLIEHITSCRYCFEEFQLILEIQREEKKLIQKLNEFFIEHSKKKGAKRKRIYFPFFQKSRIWAFSACTVLVLGVGLALYIIFIGELKPKFRGTDIGHIKLIQPVQNKTTKTPIVFHWGKLENAEYYILELFDEKLFPIWKSQKNRENKILLPVNITETLSPGKSYYWLITGFVPGERKFESSLEQFQIKK